MTARKRLGFTRTGAPSTRYGSRTWHPAATNDIWIPDRRFRGVRNDRSIVLQFLADHAVERVRPAAAQGDGEEQDSPDQDRFHLAEALGAIEPRNASKFDGGGGREKACE